jgi:hypothetical protein
MHAYNDIKTNLLMGSNLLSSADSTKFMTNYGNRFRENVNYPDLCIPTFDTLRLTVNDSVTINDSIYTTSGVYTQHFIDYADCDVTLTIYLTVNTSASIRDNVNAEALCATSLRAWVQDDILHIEGLTIGKTYRIYTISGMLVHQGIAKSDIETWNSTSNTGAARNASTVYIIQSENKSVKIVY